MLKAAKYIPILFAAFLFFTNCKKYPENKRKLFNSPKSDIVGSFHLTAYTVNDIDSLPLLNSTIGNDITSGIGWEFFDKNFESSGPNGCYLGSDLGHGYYSFSNKLKDLNVEFYPLDQGIQTLNIFITKNSVWQILALYKKKNYKILKIKREYNGKTYIIQFN